MDLAERTRFGGKSSQISSTIGGLEWVVGSLIGRGYESQGWNDRGGAVQGESRRTCGELRLVGHRSSEDNLEGRGGRGGAKMGKRDEGVTNAQARQYTLARRADCWEVDQGRGEILSWANLLWSWAWLDEREF